MYVIGFDGEVVFGCCNRVKVDVVKCFVSGVVKVEWIVYVCGQSLVICVYNMLVYGGFGVGL